MNARVSGLRALRDDYAQHEGTPKALQEIFRAHDLFESSYRNLSKARRDLGMLAFDLSDDYDELDDIANTHGCPRGAAI